MLSFIMLFYLLFVINVDGGCRYSGGVLACCADSRPNCDVTKDNLDSVCSIKVTQEISPENMDLFTEVYGTCREYCESTHSVECYIWINGYDSSKSECYCVNSCSCSNAAEINDEEANSIDYDNMKSTNNNNNNNNKEIIFVIIALIVSISLLICLGLGYYLYKNNKNKTSLNYKPTNDEDQDEIVDDGIEEMKEEQAVDEIEMINPDITQLSTK